MARTTRAGRRADNLLTRILETPNLAHVVPRLPPAILHRVVETCGLEDCGELVALATPEQLSAVFDLDLWRSDQPGADESFDAARFGLWLEVLAESGADFAAQKLAQIDASLVVAALAGHIAVFDPAVFSSPSSDVDGLDVVTGADRQENAHYEVGGYTIAAKRVDCWDTILAVLLALDEQYTDYFHRVMRGCRRLSNSTPEADGFHDLLSDPEQFRFDLDFDRERRRETQGYMTPAQSRAFLQASRQLRLEQIDPLPPNAIASAYFRGIGSNTNTTTNPHSTDATGLPDHASSEESGSAMVAMFDVLLDAGVIPEAPRALLDGAREEEPGLKRFRQHMQFARDHDPAAYLRHSQELAFLANVLVSGCPFQARTFTTREAFDAATAVCNLGLENWPRHWPSDALVNADLADVFQVGWAALHRQVCLFAAERLIDVLDGLRISDRDLQIGVLRLRRDLTRHLEHGAPWRARDALEVIAMLDMPAWAALLGLIAECPVMLANVSRSRATRPHAIDTTAFEFISANTHIAWVHDFIQSLPEALTG